MFVSIIKVEDRDLVRHESLAYLDGYADARALGKDGFWVSDSYNKFAREAYLQGFQRGLRVYRILQGEGP